jgi:predicted MFS family arabinose efflux permease
VVTIGQFIGFTVPFAVLTLIALVFTIILFRTCSDMTTDKTPSAHMAHV